MKKKLLIIFLNTLLGIPTAYAELPSSKLIPQNGNDLYYQFGGGNVTPLPPIATDNRIPLGVNGVIGLGYNCGVFDPQLSLKNSLNSVKSSFEQMISNTIADAKGAVQQIPAYVIAKANPQLYQLLQSALFNARTDLDVSTKSCQQMSAEIAAGNNPFNDWLKASMGDDWKYYMNPSSKVSSGRYGDPIDKDDINQVKSQVEKDNGTTGVTWVQGIPQSDKSKYAGGVNQPVISLINDIVIAGYNILIDPKNRSYDDKSAPSSTSDNAGITTIFPAPTDASAWATHVLGEQTITTYPNGDKSSTPGVGLLWDVQQQTQQLNDSLRLLVSGSEDMSIANLQAVSAPRVMINQDVIKTIRDQVSPVMQAIIIEKLATEVASARVIDKAQLTLQFLMVGEQAPPVYGNKPAVQAINDAIARLKDNINQFMFDSDVNQKFVSKTVSQLLQDTVSEQAANASIRPEQNSSAVIKNGAIQSGA